MREREKMENENGRGLLVKGTQESFVPFLQLYSKSEITSN